MKLHRYEVFRTQSGKSHPWFLIFARNLHHILIVIPISLFLVHNSTIIAEHEVKSSLSISPCHDHELTTSTAYTEYSIHRVQHTPKIVRLACILMIMSRPLNVALASDVPPWDLKDIVTLSHSHGCELTKCRKQSEHPARRPSTASQYSSKLARIRPPNSPDHGLQLYLQTRLITASKCISKLARS